MGKSFSEVLKAAQAEPTTITPTTEEHEHIISSLIYVQTGRLICGACEKATYIPEQGTWLALDDSLEKSLKK